MSTPFTDWFAVYLSAPLGKQMTQTYWDAPQRETTFADAWLSESADPTNRARLVMLAERYVAFNKMRPLQMGLEIIIPKGTDVAGVPADDLLPDDMKMGGFDYGHFCMSVLADISRFLQNEGQHERDIADDALKLLYVHTESYFNQKNSWLALKNTTYSQYGKCRIAAMIVRVLTDVASMPGTSNAAYRTHARALLVQHLYNIAITNMADDAQGDGMKVPHWRGFQVAILIAALERVKKVFGSELDTEHLIAAKHLREIVAATVQRDPNGKPTGKFFYDVPNPIALAGDWTLIPGAKLNDGNGVELWSYRYMPPDAQKIIVAMNPKLHPAVGSKYGLLLV